MRLHFDVIQDNLPKDYLIRRYGSVAQSYAFARPLLYERGSEFQENTLYVAQAETLPKALPPQTAGVICIGTRIPREWLAGQVQLLVLQNTPGILAVFNDIHAMFNHFDAWDEQMRDELEKDEDFDIRRLLCLGAKILERNISVEDHTLRGMFRTEFVRTSRGEVVVRLAENPEPISMENSEKIKEACRLERIITVPYLSSMEDNGQKIYCNNLYPIGSFSGCISIMEGDRPFRESDYHLMDHFFTYFQKSFLKYLRHYGQAENISLTALRNMLNHEQIGGDAQAQFSLQPGESWVCFKMRECRGERALIKEYMYATLNSILPRTVYAIIHHGEIVGIIRLQTSTLENNVLQFFGETLRRMGYIGGISNPFTDLHFLGDYLRQASYAVEYEHSEEGPLYFFRNQSLSYILDVCTQELPAESLYSQGLIALLGNDEKKGTEYIKTLDTYLQNETHITKTAEALYIHRSSLIKRLNKIQQLLGDNLEDPDVRLYYRICLALLKRER